MTALILIAIIGAGAIAGVGYLYRRGYRDAERRKQAEWNDAIDQDIERAERARRDAVRDVARGVQSHDKWDRD